MKHLLPLVLVTVCAQAQLSFVFDYSYDSNAFFTGANASRQTQLEAAGTYLSSILSPTVLSDITPGGTNSWTATFFEPDSGNAGSADAVTVAANTILVYAGGRALGGSTLGQGGAGGFSAGGNSAWFDTIKHRGNGTFSTGWGGSITFNTATNWYFDNDINDVEDFAGQFDFFSVAIHELVHLLGFGGGGTWDSLVTLGSPSVFTGAQATALVGSNPILAAGDAHWALNTSSTVFGTAIAQEAAMDPNIADNARKYLTSLDVAALQDIGYSAVPEPAAFAALLGAGALLCGLRRRRA